MSWAMQTMQTVEAVFCVGYIDIQTVLRLSWKNQDVLYDFTADVTGIGDRSVHETNDVQVCMQLCQIDADIEVFTPASVDAR